MTPDEEQRAIGEVINRIAGRLPGLPRTTIEATVEQSLRQFDDRPIRDYVPLFVERATIDTLADQAPTVAPNAAVLDLPDEPPPTPADEPPNLERPRRSFRALTGHRKQPRHASRPRQMSSQD
jgi:hypothetical protein